MDQKGIGTDATIAAHITKIQERGCDLLWSYALPRCNF